MSRGFGATYGSGITDNIDLSFVGSATQRSWAIWAYRADATSDMRIWAKEKADGTLPQENLHQYSGKYRFYRKFSTTSAIWSVPEPSVAEWHHVLVTFDNSSDANDPVIYIDGVSQTVTEVVTPSGSAQNTTDGYMLGNYRPGLSNNIHWRGYLAEFAVWDSILTSGNATSLAAGALPNSIGSPACYFRVLGDDSPELDISLSRYSGTVTGTAKRNHPPLLQGYLKYRKP